MSTPSVQSPLAPARLIPPLVLEVLEDFSREHGVEVRFWIRTPEGWLLGYPRSPVGQAAPGTGAIEVAGGGGTELRLEVAGEPPPGTGASIHFLATVLARTLQHDAEARFFARELAERYEEITLLYSISEILGSVVSLSEAARVILDEVKSTVGADRATLWVHNPEKDYLELAAAVGGEGQTGPIAVADRNSATAEVFRERRPLIFEPEDVFPREDVGTQPTQRGDFLSVPVSYSPPEGETRTVGVINVVRRSSREPFSAGDLKLMTAIASQVGAAVENSRLVASSLRQERLVRELELAHDLQLKLLPAVERFVGQAEVAARCVPAQAVGGDFYQLFRLPGKRLGVVIGDVSSHGFGAALIMALTMSAVAIHASEGDPPAEVLRRVHRALIDELTSTEMYVTLFYGVIDPGRGKITYASAGHPHVFRFPASGKAERLFATGPPLGMIDLDLYQQSRSPWQKQEDLLFLFTDGLPRALPEGERAGEEVLLKEVRRGRKRPVAELLERVFALVPPEPDAPPDDRTAMLVRI